MKNLRQERLSNEIKKTISEIINTSFKVKYPDVKGIISILEADVAPDLKNAKIYVSIYDKDEQTRLNAYESLKDGAKYIRSELAAKMRVRTVPALHFILDASMEYGVKIDSIINKIYPKE